MQENRVREIARQCIAWVVRFAQVVRSTADGQGDQVAGRADSDEPDQQVPVRRIWPFGLRSRPPAGCDAAVVHVNGGSSNGIMVGAESSAYGPDDLEDGEAALYCKVAGCLFKMTMVGKVELTSASGQAIAIDAGSGADVVVNGGSLKVARVTDPVNLGACFVTLNGSGAVTAVTINGTALPVGADALSPPNRGTVASGGGASRFKA